MGARGAGGSSSRERAKGHDIVPFAAAAAMLIAPRRLGSVSPGAPCGGGAWAKRGRCRVHGRARSAVMGRYVGVLNAMTPCRFSTSINAQKSDDAESDHYKPMPHATARDIDRCLTVYSGDQILVMEAFGPDSIRVRAYLSALRPFEDPPSAFVLRGATNCPETSAAQLSNGNLRVDISNGILAFTRISDRKLLVKEAHQRTFGKPRVGKDLASALVAEDMGFRSLHMTFITSDLAQERIFGLGSRKAGVFDNQGQIYQLAQSNGDVNVPLLHSSIGYSMLVNCPGHGNVSLNGSAEWNIDAVAQADVWVTTSVANRSASSWAQRLSNYGVVTGRPPVLPYWTTGLWQSKDRYGDLAEPSSVVNGFIARALPVSLVVLDWFNWGENPFGATAFVF